MRIVTWNCRVGGFRRKAEAVARLRPDILAVQEVESFDEASIFSGESQPTFRDRMADPAYPRRGIGMFSYTSLGLQAVDLPLPLYSFRRYEARRGDLKLHIAAVWPWQTKSARTAYRQAHEGLSLHKEWIQSEPTIVLGDFNASPRFKGRNWSDLLALTNELGLVSAYHVHRPDDVFGSETSPTYFHRGKEAEPFHLDYCFVPAAWAPRITKVEVGRYSDWKHLSDHAPLIVDVDI